MKTNKEDNEQKITDYVEEIVSEEEKAPEIEIAQQPEFFKVPKKFGTVPVSEIPLGFTKGKQYYDKFPYIRLPFQRIEEFSFGNPDLEPKNKLYWGDNLHIMRMLPSESIDLIYIDPPFFSGKQYNVIFGDKNEVRSFNDIWDGGMPTYLIWLNARLLEMKRLLKSTGSIYVHLDWHASHYVKVEMDKIFGYDNFRNEIIYCYGGGGIPKRDFPRKHDNILRYTKDWKVYETFNTEYRPYGNWIKVHQPRHSLTAGGTALDTERGTPLNDWWNDITHLTSYQKEWIGYPTQKPDALLERIIKASSHEGDVVADFFVGGGTTPAVAQRLGRRWIASDISRIAVEITKGRILKLLKSQKQIQTTFASVPNIELFSWGYYDISTLSKLKDDEFRDFIVEAFGARKVSDPFIHGTKGGTPVWVGPKDHNSEINDDDVLTFAEYIEKYYETVRKGIMIGWQFSEKARKAQEMLLKMGAGIDFVNISLVPIGSTQFKDHITKKSPEYEMFLRFILPPSVRMRTKKIAGLEYEFDFTESISLNDGKIINIQADFNYDGVFTPDTGYAVTNKNQGSERLILRYKFPNYGKYNIAFKVEDDQGGETLYSKELEVG
ncbi:MAG: site-specific DNA-methyltransferase [Thermoplasmata archaeon]